MQEQDNGLSIHVDVNDFSESIDLSIHRKTNLDELLESLYKHIELKGLNLRDLALRKFNKEHYSLVLIDQNDKILRNLKRLKRKS